MREYQKSLSVDILKKRITNMLGTHSLYIHGQANENNTYSDCADFMSTLNESDVEKAIEYKQKKLTLIANRLGDVQGCSEFERTLNVVDSETGQIF